MKEKETGAHLHDRGCNCAQAVLMTMEDKTEIPGELACRMACGFGGGMRAGELCGAATGAVMSIGLALGNRQPEDAQTRDRAYSAVIEFNRRFKERFGSLICRELLGVDTSTPQGKLEVQQHPERKAICPTLIAGAEELAREIITEYREA